MSTRSSIPLCEPEISGSERTYLAEAVGRNELAMGGFIPRFERMVADYVGTRHAVAVSSGTAALHLSLLAAGVGPGDEVIVPALTFIATANAVRYCGATPVIVDVEPYHWCMDPRQAERALRPGVKAIIPVHLLGHPFDYGPMPVPPGATIEDATEALGASWCDQKVGALGNMACLSFNGNKLITTGGGGMMLTDSDELATRVRYLANQAKDDPHEFVHKETGYNYRMSNLAAAVGCAQMEDVEDKLASKRRIAERYAAGLAGVPGITLPREAPWARSAWWLYTIRVSEREYGMGSRELMRRLEAEGIQSRPLWTPLHRQPSLRGCPAYGGEVAERIHAEALSLPSSVGLSEEDQERVIAVIRYSAR